MRATCCPQCIRVCVRCTIKREMKIICTCVYICYILALCFEEAFKKITMRKWYTHAQLTYSALPQMTYFLSIYIFFYWRNSIVYDFLNLLRFFSHSIVCKLVLQCQLAKCIVEIVCATYATIILIIIVSQNKRIFTPYIFQRIYCQNCIKIYGNMFARAYISLIYVSA